MNQEQVLSTVRNVIALVGGFAIGHGWISTDLLTMLSGVVAAVFPVVWSMYAHTVDQQLKVVERNPDIKAIVVEKSANGSAATAAANPDRGKVILEGQKTASETDRGVKN